MRLPTFVLAALLAGGLSAHACDQPGTGTCVQLDNATKGIVPPVAGGTGIANNAANTLSFTGAYPLGLALSGATALTLPTSGTVATTAIFAAPPAIGGTTPAAGTFTGLTVVPPSGAASLILNDAAGSQQSAITLEDAGVAKWQIGKQTDNSFFINDAVNSKLAAAFDTTGQLTLGEGSNKLILPPTGAITLGTVIGLNVTPASGTTDNGINITQTGPNTSSQSGYASYNEIYVNNGVNNHAGNNYAWGLRIDLNDLSNANGQSTSLYLSHTHDVVTANAGDQIGLVIYNESTASDGGTSGTAAGTMYASNPIVHTLSGATFYDIVEGEEIDVGMDTGSSANKRLGLSIVSYAPVNGSVYDAALDVTAPIGGTGLWNTAILLENAIRGGTGAPISATGCIICTDGASATIATGIDISSYTTTGNFLRSNNFVQASNALGFYAGNALSTAYNALPGMAAHTDIAISANNSVGISMNTTALILYRDASDGGSALVFCEAGYGPQIVSQTSANNFTVTDPGAGGNKFWLQNSASHYCDAMNRYSVSKNLTYILLSTSGGTYQ